VNKTHIDIQGMYERFKAKHAQYTFDGNPRSAHQMTVLMAWCINEGAKDNV